MDSTAIEIYIFYISVYSYLTSSLLSINVILLIIIEICVHHFAFRATVLIYLNYFDSYIEKYRLQIEIAIIFDYQ